MNCCQPWQTAGTRAVEHAGEVKNWELSWSEKLPTLVTTVPVSNVPLASKIGAPETWAE